MRFIFLAFLLTSTLAFAAPSASIHVTALSADLEMKDFHDTERLNGPLEVGVPVTLTFKNHAKVTIVPVRIGNETIKLTAHLSRGSGTVLYNATFFTHYNVNADLSEKNPKGDLVYRLKLDPQALTEQ